MIARKERTPTVRLGVLRSIGHNIADSLASGIGLMIGVYQTDVFREAAGNPDRSLTVDFLRARVVGAASPSLLGAVIGYRDALPDLCARHGIAAADFVRLTATYTQTRGPGQIIVRIEDRWGRSAEDAYRGVPARRMRVMDHAGHPRPVPTDRSGSLR